jgi:hypothetical protein
MDMAALAVQHAADQNPLFLITARLMDVGFHLGQRARQISLAVVAGLRMLVDHEIRIAADQFLSVFALRPAALRMLVDRMLADEDLFPAGHGPAGGF